jgi:hypothetical protein
LIPRLEKEPLVLHQPSGVPSSSGKEIGFRVGKVATDLGGKGSALARLKLSDVASGHFQLLPRPILALVGLASLNNLSTQGLY